MELKQRVSVYTPFRHPCSGGWLKFDPVVSMSVNVRMELSRVDYDAPEQSDVLRLKSFVCDSAGDEWQAEEFVQAHVMLLKLLESSFEVGDLGKRADAIALTPEIKVYGDGRDGCRLSVLQPRAPGHHGMRRTIVYPLSMHYFGATIRLFEADGPQIPGRTVGRELYMQFTSHVNADVQRRVGEGASEEKFPSLLDLGPLYTTFFPSHFLWRNQCMPGDVPEDGGFMYRRMDFAVSLEWSRTGARGEPNAAVSFVRL